MAFGSVFDAS